MTTTNKLKTILVHPKHHFDPLNLEDLREYQYFLNNRKWRTVCPFLVEWPHTSILYTIEEKIIRAHLKDIINNVEGNKRFARKKPIDNMVLVSQFKKVTS